MAFYTAFGRGTAHSGRRNDSAVAPTRGNTTPDNEWGNRPAILPYDQRNDNRPPPPPFSQQNAEFSSRRNPSPPPRGSGIRLINGRDNRGPPPPGNNNPGTWQGRGDDNRTPPPNDSEAWRGNEPPRDSGAWQGRDNDNRPPPLGNALQMRQSQPFPPRPVTREQAIYGPPRVNPPQSHPNGPPAQSQPFSARAPPTSNNNIPPREPVPPSSNRFDRDFDDDNRPPQPRVQQPYLNNPPPRLPYEEYDRVPRDNNSTQLSNAIPPRQQYDNNGFYPPHPGQQQLPTLHEERDSNQFRPQQQFPPGIRRVNNDLREPSLPFGQNEQHQYLHPGRRSPSPFNQSVRSSIPPNNYVHEAQYGREPVAPPRPPHNYRSGPAPSPVPSMRSQGPAPDLRNAIPQQGNENNRRRDFHNYFDVQSPPPPRQQQPAMSNNDGYYQQRQQQRSPPTFQRQQDDESFNQVFQNRNVISRTPPPPFGNNQPIRGGYGGATNPRGGFNNAGSGRGGYNGLTSSRTGFTGNAGAVDGFNSAPRNHRYNDRRTTGPSPPPLFGYRGAFQQHDSQSTNRNRAPKNYVPVNRNVEEIFAEDSEEVNRYATMEFVTHCNTIENGDAEVEVVGQGEPARCEHWGDMQLDPQLLSNIHKSDYRKPRNIQQYVIPYMMDGFNVKVQSETGSGKTAAFLIPLIHNLIKEKQQRLLPDGPIVLIISPTRELSYQLCEQAKKFAHGTGITVSYAYGQIDTAKNLADISRGANILCACLGRLMDFVESSRVSLRYVRYLVIDEADRLMDNREDNNGLLKLLNYPQLPRKDQRQTCLFSATLKDPVVEIVANEHVDDKKQVFIIAKAESNARIKYVVLAVPSIPAKFRYLMQYLKEITLENNGECPRVLVFVNRKINVDRVAVDITSGGFPATTIHGDRGQDLREEALRSFRSGKTKCLVATDVCARGVDIKDLDYVINYDLPDNRTGFVQRCGRTGRTHGGVAVSFYCEESDLNMAETIDGIINHAGQHSPEFLRNGVKAGDFIYDEPPPPQNAAYSSRQENDRSPLDDQRDSGYSRNNSPYDEEQQQNIPDNDVDSEWN